MLDEGLARPDPVTRYQPVGVHGASQVVDTQRFPWTDQEWLGVAKRDLIIYEMHVGTFTAEGSFRAAIGRLAELSKLGVTAVEVMPVAQTPGQRNWGYDGVDLYAVRNTYGKPDDFKAFIDACHEAGIAVLLDVVYNHLGPEGNYLNDFAPYFSRKHRTPWGEALNFDGRKASEVRRFIIENAVSWLDEFHLDGLRLDAIHFMLDDSRPHILTDVREAVTEYAAGTKRIIHLIAESNVYEHELVVGGPDRPPYDAIWCDCLMHSIYTHARPDLMLPHRQYHGAQDLAEVLEHGYVFAGAPAVRVSSEDRRVWRRESGPHPIESFVMALQTHDSVGNHPRGLRVHQLTSKSFQKAAAGLVLLFPGIPLIFMGEEYAVESPFPFFVDFEDQRLNRSVDRGRPKEYPQHDWTGALPPSSEEAFRNARCHAADRQDPDMYAWYRSVIAVRKQGLDEGWLAADRLTVRHDLEQHLFSLHYARDERRNVAVHVRLTGPRETDVAPLSFPLDGRIVLDSEPAAAGRLLPNHAVVVM